MNARVNAPGDPRFSADWLSLREEADAAARATGLLAPLRAHLAAAVPPAQPLVIRDLGCGTGSMGRWLAPRLRGPQHWVLHDRDPDLLARAATALPAVAGGAGAGTPMRTAADTAAGTAGESGDGTAGGGAQDAAVTVETCEGDLADLGAADLAGTSLVTASALLDLLTAAEVDRLVAACATARCPALLTLSVVGRVELAPADPFDGEFAAAFNAHQRRTTDGRRLLGPDAGPAAARAFARHGAHVMTRPSPWRLDSAASAGQAALLAEWLRGWVGAARAQRPDLDRPARDYLSRRLSACAAGRLTAVVHHIDLLALPAPDRPSAGSPPAGPANAGGTDR